MFFSLSLPLSLSLYLSHSLYLYLSICIKFLFYQNYFNILYLFLFFSPSLSLSFTHTLSLSLSLSYSLSLFLPFGKFRDFVIFFNQENFFSIIRIMFLFYFPTKHLCILVVPYMHQFSAMVHKNIFGVKWDKFTLYSANLASLT